MKLCRHCNDATVSRPRGLCWRCYYTPGVKECYADNNRYGVGIDVEPEPATTPTDARPGTEEKIAVMAERAAARESLWHDGDNWVLPDSECGLIGPRRWGTRGRMTLPAHGWRVIIADGYDLPEDDDD